MPFPSFQTYGELVYSLPDRHPAIQRSTLVLATIGPMLAKLEGQVTFGTVQRLNVDWCHSWPVLLYAGVSSCLHLTGPHWPDIIET